jgi:hypothetical protein
MRKIYLNIWYTYDSNNKSPYKCQIGSMSKVGHTKFPQLGTC